MTTAAKPKKEKVQHSSNSLLGLLRERYPNDSHVTLGEVRDAAGFSASRSCDALSLGTWPSRGLTLRGFEIKVSRSDWLREFRDPKKADSFAVFCDEWYLVAGDTSIVQADELPETWGLLVAKGTRLECAKPATRNPSPAPVDRGLLVAMLKRAKDQGPTEKALAGARAEGVAAGRREIEAEQRRTGNAVEQLRSLEKKVTEFEQASGVNINDRWTYASGQRIGEAVRLVMNGADKAVASRLNSMLLEARSLVSTLEPIVIRAAQTQIEKPAQSCNDVQRAPEDRRDESLNPHNGGQ